MSSRTICKGLTRTIIGALALGAVLAFAASQPIHATHLARQSDAIDASPCSLFPPCRPQADVCGVSDWFQYCGLSARTFVTTEKWNFCDFWSRNVLSDPKHCGSCGTACYPGEPYCVSGICSRYAPVTIDLRIEGDDFAGTIFEGKVATSGRWLQTDRGGYGRRDGTEVGNGDMPRGTITTALDDVARINGFTWDGTYYEEMGWYDFYPTRIAWTYRGLDNGWDPLHNGSQFPQGACMEPADPSEPYLWAWGAYRYTYMLILDLSGPETAQAGTPVTYTVTGKDPKTDNVVPVEGVKVRDQLTDANGQVTFMFNERCCFYLKASKEGHIRSNGLWTTVS